MLVRAASVKWLTYSYICTYFPARFCITFQDLYVDNCVAKQANKIIIVCIRYTCINENIIQNNSPSCISCNINKKNQIRLKKKPILGLHAVCNILHYYKFLQKQSRFGSGVAVLDINLDGVLDLAVGSPAYYIDSPLEYKVCIRS